MLTFIQIATYFIDSIDKVNIFHLFAVFFFKMHAPEWRFFLFIKTNFVVVSLELIEAKTTGCFDLLDEESKLPTPRPEHFTGEVHNRNRGHPRLDVGDIDRRRERETEK